MGDVSRVYDRNQRYACYEPQMEKLCRSRISDTNQPAYMYSNVGACLGMSDREKMGIRRDIMYASEFLLRFP